MPYVTRILPAITSEIQSWGLPEAHWMDVVVFLHQTVASNPPQYLRRMLQPCDGVVATLEQVDPTNSARRHGFLFHVLSHADEEHLAVVGAAHLQTFTT